MSMLVGAPWLLAHKSMLQVNKPKKISLYGSDYVMWKDARGEINALSNICPHMGAMLSEGWCQEKEDNSSTVVCPFHALEFDNQGCTILPDSNKKSLPQLKPLELVIQGDFIWSYGGMEAKIPIPNILNEIGSEYDFIGHTADTSVETELLAMLLNMHDYNHQNGTHSPLFKIKEVQFEKFVDNGHQSHAFYNMPTAPVSLAEKIQKPDLFLIPKVIKAHLENHFPCLVIFHGKTVFGKIAQCHLFVPESENKTRTYVLMFGEKNSLGTKYFGKTALEFAKVVVEQDIDILGKIYPNAEQKIKLNNEVGMDWVKRNFDSFPEVVKPDFSKGGSRE